MEMLGRIEADICTGRATVSRGCGQPCTYYTQDKVHIGSGAERVVERVRVGDMRAHVTIAHCVDMP